MRLTVQLLFYLLLSIASLESLNSNHFCKLVKTHHKCNNLDYSIECGRDIVPQTSQPVTDIAHSTHTTAQIFFTIITRKTTPHWRQSY